MPFERRDLERTLVSKLGFRVEEGTHRIFILRIGGKIAAKTRISRGNQYRTIGNSLISEIARQIHCTRSLLERLVTGSATREDYLQNLVSRGIISPEDPEGI